MGIAAGEAARGTEDSPMNVDREIRLRPILPTEIIPLEVFNLFGVFDVITNVETHPVNQRDLGLFTIESFENSESVLFA